MSIPGSGSPLLLASTAAAAAADTAYVIPKSLRFNSGDSSYLSKVFATSGNRRTYTISFWVKPTTQPVSGTDNVIAGHMVSGFQTQTMIRINGLGQLEFGQFTGSWNFRKITTRLLRDPASFYHIVWAVNTTDSTAEDRIKLYINGTRETDWSTNTLPSQNLETLFNSNVEHGIGKALPVTQHHGNFYLADFQFVDGQALAPTAFGETRSSDGVWVPKEASFTSLNDGTIWSANVSASTGSIAYASSGFDGNTTTAAYANSSASDTYIYVDFSPALSGTFKLWHGMSSGSPTAIVTHSGGSSTVSVSTGGVSLGTFTSVSRIAINRGEAATHSFQAIAVDGLILVDNVGKYGKNGFHLNFSDSSTNEALGFDSAPTISALDPKKGFDVVTYTGTGSELNLGGLNFEPGLVWVKCRSHTSNHALYDIVRGVSNQLESQATTAEVNYPNSMRRFNPDGFTVGTDGIVNTSGRTFVGWTWRAGGPAVANSDGAVTSQVSVNTDYGFSIVTVTPTATGQTVGHGLSATPSWIIYKNRDTAGNWRVHHTSLGTSKTLFLNTNGAESTSSDRVTAVTSSTFTLGDIVANDDHVAYCWSEVSGYSKFGSFSGSGSSGNTVTTGFKPRFVLLKRSDTTGNWFIFDSERGTGKTVWADLSDAEDSNYSIDVNENSFTLNGTAAGMNASGGTYVYAAFADRPGNNWDVNNIVTNEGLTTSKSQFDVVTYTGNGGTQKIGGRVYSSYVSFSPSQLNSSRGGDKAFNGSTSDNASAATANGSNVTITFSPSLTSVSSLEVYSASNSSFAYVNGASGTTVNITANNYTSLNSLASGASGTISSLSVQTNGDNATIAAVKVNGTVLIDGTGPGLKFQPDFVWIKNRDENINNALYDSVRGNTKVIFSNKTEAEATVGDFTSFNSDGFTVAYANRQETNKNNINYVAWCWKAGGTAVSNTDGSITSSVSANAAYGFSVVNHVGTNAAGTFGHGLNQAPDLMIFKNREATDNWFVWARSADGTATTGGVLNNSNAFFTNGTNELNSTLPTDSVIHVGSNLATNGNNQDVVTYCFHNVPGYQRIGSYIGNGSTTGPVVVTGFKPRFILLRSTSGSRGWLIYDTERDTNSTNDNCLFPHTVGAENSDSSHNIEILDNGFQPKTTSVNRNGSGETYIYLAIGDDEIGSDEDCMVDVPNAVTADADATDTTGGYQRGNYATLNPLDHNCGSATFSEGNLKIQTPTNSGGVYVSTIATPTTGKWYAEVKIVALSANQFGRVGLVQVGQPRNTSQLGNDPGQISYRLEVGDIRYNMTTLATGGSAASVGDIIGLALDLDNQILRVTRNGAHMTTASNIPQYQWFFAGSDDYTSYSATHEWNFGQQRFKYGLPSGYAALNTTALPAATIADSSNYFDTLLWTGNNAVSRTLTGLEFSPDFVWHQARSIAWGSGIVDAVRGVGSGGPTLRTFNNAAEETVNNFGAVTALTSDGFTVSKGGFGSSQWAYVNQSNATYVAWNWDAGSSTVSNTDGSITSSVRANQSAGFSIVKYTGTSASTNTVGHGLNAEVKFIMLKSNTATDNWFCYHIGLDATSPANYDISLNTTGARRDYDTWNDTKPTNSVFSVGNTGASNENGRGYIAYCFAEVSQYSSIGSYSGNSSSDGVFVYTGFRPAWILLKRTDSGIRSWEIHDTARSPINVSENNLLPNTNGAESSGSARLDILSNGFKLRTTSNGINNGNIIYVALAENPFSANGGLAR